MGLRKCSEMGFKGRQREKATIERDRAFDVKMGCKKIRMFAAAKVVKHERIYAKKTHLRNRAKRENTESKGAQSSDDVE